MTTWLIESSTFLYMLLAILAGGLLFAWWKTKKTWMALTSAVPIALIAGLILLGRLVETDAGKIEKSIHEMVAGLQAQDLDRIFGQISDSFRYSALDKAAFRRNVQDTMRRQHVTDAQVWDFSVLDLSRERRQAQIEFSVKPRGTHPGADQQLYYRCLAEYTLDPDDQWRLEGFQIFNPYVREKLHIPGYD